MSGNFGRIIVADFEYEVRDGDLPNVLCMVAYELDEHLQHVRTIRKWRGEFGSRPPFDIGDDTLFVAYSGVGGDDMLQGAGLAISSSHLRSTHSLPCCNERSAAAATDTHKRPKKDLRPPVAPTASKVGSASTRAQ